MIKITRTCSVNVKNTDHVLCVFASPTKVCSNMPHLVPKSTFLTCAEIIIHASVPLFHLGGSTPGALLARCGGRRRCLGFGRNHRNTGFLARIGRARATIPSFQEN